MSDELNSFRPKKPSGPAALRWLKRITPFHIFAAIGVVAVLALLGILNAPVTAMFKSETTWIRDLGIKIARAPDYALFFGVIWLVHFALTRLIRRFAGALPIAIGCAFVVFYGLPSVISSSTADTVEQYFADDQPFDATLVTSNATTTRVGMPNSALSNSSMPNLLPGCQFTCLEFLIERPGSSLTLYPADPRDESLKTFAPDPEVLMANVPAASVTYTTRAHNGAGCGYDVPDDQRDYFMRRHMVGVMESEGGRCIVSAPNPTGLDFIVTEQAGYLIVGRSPQSTLQNAPTGREMLQIPERDKFTVRNVTAYQMTNAGPTVVYRASEAWPHYAITPLSISDLGAAGRRYYGTDLGIVSDGSHQEGLSEDLQLGQFQLLLDAIPL